MNHAHALGIRVVADLVANHTSIDHPWFQSARSIPSRLTATGTSGRTSARAGTRRARCSLPMQSTTWTRDKKARKYYFHRFYEHQPDFNTHHPAFREELYKIMGFWLQLGVSGFRMDAVPFLVERKGANVKPVKDFALLEEMRRFLQWRARDAILLAEANVPPQESLHYFGDEGDRLQMMLNFPVNQRLYYAFATGDPGRSSARSARRSPTCRAMRSGCSSCEATTSSTSAGSPTRSESACSRCSRRSRTCSSTTAASAGASRRCSATTAGAWSSRTACSSRFRARR